MNRLNMICNEIILPIWKGVRDMIVVWACLHYLGAVPALGEYDPKMAVGDQWGLDWGPAAHKDCPASPTDASPLKEERMDDVPKPRWGRLPGVPGPVRSSYGVAPNLEVCRYDIERERRRAIMQERCWPTWHGEPNRVTQAERWCEGDMMPPSTYGCTLPECPR
jgi:hypothetical protein